MRQAGHRRERTGQEKSPMRGRGKDMAQMSTRRKKMLARRRKRRVAICGLVLAAILIVYLVIQLFLFFSVRKYNTNTILEGVRIGTLDVSGMTQKEALAALDAQLASYDGTTLTMKLDDTRSADAVYAELGLKYRDEKALVNEAMNYGRTKSLWSRYRAIKKLKKEEKVFEPEYTLTKKSVQAMVDERIAPLLNPPVNATLSRSGDTTVVNEGTPGEVIDTAASIKSVEKILNKNWKGEAATVTLVDTEQEPEIIGKDLSGIHDLLGAYTTFYSADGTGHAQNVEQGAKNISGSIVMPGETFSTNDTIGPEDEEHGFAKAGSYENGTVVQTFGGGVCQESTTLYNAVLLAELEVVQRDQHSMVVAYVEPSMDAAIADDVKDFKFKNNLENPIYIESTLQDGNITFNIYGKETRDPNRTVEYLSETLDTTEDEGEKFVGVDQPIGYLQAIQAYQGISAQLWKIVYENGEEVSRDVVNTSHYQATPLTYSIGTTSDNQTAAATVVNAMASKDLETIQAAIQQALEQEYAAAAGTTADDTYTDNAADGTDTTGY